MFVSTCFSSCRWEAMGGKFTCQSPYRRVWRIASKSGTVRCPFQKVSMSSRTPSRRSEATKGKMWSVIEKKDCCDVRMLLSSAWSSFDRTRSPRTSLLATKNERHDSHMTWGIMSGRHLRDGHRSSNARIGFGSVQDRDLKVSSSFDWLRLSHQYRLLKPAELHFCHCWKDCRSFETSAFKTSTWSLLSYW